MNKYFSYENMKLWDDEVWKDKYSCVRELGIWINVKNHEHWQLPAGFLNDGRENDRYDSKTRSLMYDDVIAYWKEQGLVFRSSEMGGVRWHAMVPQKVVSGEVKNPKIIVELINVDAKDLKWNMAIIEKNKEFYKICAEQGIMPVVVVEHDDVFGGTSYMGVLQELSVIYQLDMKDVWLNVTTVFNENIKLSDVPDFNYKDTGGNKQDPETALAYLTDLKIPCLDITDRWSNKVGSLMKLVQKKEIGYDGNAVIHSQMGEYIAGGMEIEYTYTSSEDPAFRKYIADRGLRYDLHSIKGYPWVCVAPEAAFEDPDKKLPVILIFQEVVTSFQRVCAMSVWRAWVDLAAQGECVLAMFALESADDNELFWDILQSMKGEYSVDESRVYVTGHSHNGHFCAEFARRHHEYIAGAAPLGMSPGLLAPGYTHECVPVTDAMVEALREYDLPTINICGSRENEMTGLTTETNFYQNEDNASDAMLRRLRAYRLKMRTAQEIKDAKHSENYIIRKKPVYLQTEMRSVTLWVTSASSLISRTTTASGYSETLPLQT